MSRDKNQAFFKNLFSFWKTSSIEAQMWLKLGELHVRVTGFSFHISNSLSNNLALL